MSNYNQENITLYDAMKECKNGEKRSWETPADFLLDDLNRWCCSVGGESLEKILDEVRRNTPWGYSKLKKLVVSGIVVEKSKQFDVFYLKIHIQGLGLHQIGSFRDLNKIKSSFPKLFEVSGKLIIKP